MVGLDIARQVTEGMLAATSAQGVLDALAAHGFDGVRPLQAAIAIVGSDDRLHLVAGIAVPAPIAAEFPMPIDEHRPLAHALVERLDVWIESAADRDRWYPRLQAFRDLPHAGGFMPLDLVSSPGGVLAVMFDHDRAIVESERQYWIVLSQLASLALDRLALRRRSPRRK